MNRSFRRTTLRAATVAALSATSVLLTAAPAFAHVTAQPGTAAQGGYTVVTFRVPDESDTPATQTYDDGRVVSWDQPTTDGAEPERPAPVVRLTPAAPDAMGGHDGDAPPAGPAAAAGPAPAAASRADDTARWLGGAGLLVGALGLGLGVGAVLRTRRSGAS